MKNLTIATRIWLILGAAWLVGLGASAFLLYRHVTMSSAFKSLISQELAQGQRARVLQLDFKKQVQDWKDLLLRGSDPEMLRKYTRGFQEKEAQVKKSADDLIQQVTLAEAKSRLADFRAAHDNMSAKYAEAMKQFTDSGGKNPQVADAAVKGIDRAPTDLLDKVVISLTARSNTVMQEQQDSMARERLTVTVGMILCFGAAGLLSVFTIRGLNLTLRHAVMELTEGADQIASAANQVSASSQSLAQGTSEQAASLEETSASSQEMSSMTSRNAGNSRESAQLMALVDQRVADANQTLGQMVASMNEINASSDKISRIIKVIDEIAFQTNILALNAAVEAARAGEAGMGFAVVADEVRTLAQRSAQAAKDTAALIEESIGRSHEGSAKLDQVATAIRAITESASKVKTLVDEVNLSSEEQANGVDQISKAITQMEQVTQKSAAAAEQSASAGEELSAQSETMRQVVRDLHEMVH